MKICPVVDELLHADGRTDSHDDANVAFHNFANASINKFKFTALFHSCQLILSWYKWISATHVC